MQPGMSFYGELPDSYNIIINTEQPVIKRIMEEADKDVMPKVEPINAEINSDNEKIKTLRDGAKDGKLSDEEQKQVQHLEEEVTHQRNKAKKIASEFADGQPLVKQVIDLALLANGLLRGEALNAFIRRSVSLL